MYKIPYNNAFIKVENITSINKYYICYIIPEIKNWLDDNIGTNNWCADPENLYETKLYNPELELYYQDKEISWHHFNYNNFLFRNKEDAVLFKLTFW